MLSFIPFLVLIVLITCCIAVFGNATLDGASQVSLLVASTGWKIKRRYDNA